MSKFHPDWLVPDWPVPPHVRSVFTTRAGGESPAPFDACNLGDHVGDSMASVAANRRRLATAIGATPEFLQQVHGQAVAVLPSSPHAAAQATVADASLTTWPGLACTIMVADCLPVLFTDRMGSVVAAAHAGWRGLVGADGRGVLDATLDEMLRQQKSTVADILVWLGPCIGPDAFEVGDEVRQAFVAAQPEAAACFRTAAPGKWWADLPALARLRLCASGVRQAHLYGNDSSTAWCTVRNPSRFFSYRRDGVTGRMAACIWLG